MNDIVQVVNEYPWYGIVQGVSPLAQGDLLDAFPILASPDADIDKLVEEIDNPEAHELDVRSEIRPYNVVIVTQSCDFLKLDDEEAVILVPRSDFHSLLQENPNLSWEMLIKGQYVHFHPLNRCDFEEFSFEHQVVHLRTVFAVQYSFVRRFANTQRARLRLLPPYREHLAQAFARQFMRVGLPIDLPRDI